KHANVSMNMVTFSDRLNCLRARPTSGGRTTTSIAPFAGGNLVGGRSVGKSRVGSGADNLFVQKFNCSCAAALFNHSSCHTEKSLYWIGKGGNCGTLLSASAWYTSQSSRCINPCDQPSQATWWIVTTKTWWSGSKRNRHVRNGTSRTRSNGVAASARTISSIAPSRSEAATASRFDTASSTV